MHYKLWNASPPGFWAFMTSCWRPLPWVYHLYLCRPPGVSHWLNAHPKPGGYDPLWKDTGLSSRLLTVKHRQPSLGSINVWPAKPSFNEDATFGVPGLAHWPRLSLTPAAGREWASTNDRTQSSSFSKHVIFPTWYQKHGLCLKESIMHISIPSEERKLIWKWSFATLTPYCKNKISLLHNNDPETAANQTNQQLTAPANCV